MVVGRGWGRLTGGGGFGEGFEGGGGLGKAWVGGGVGRGGVGEMLEWVREGLQRGCRRVLERWAGVLYSTTPV